MKFKVLTNESASAMIMERKPLGILDANVTRVQPTRAAKTGHKWLGSRQLENCEENPTKKVFQPRTYSQHLALQHFRSNEETKENIENPNYVPTKLGNSLSHEATINLPRYNDNCGHVSKQKEIYNFRVPLQTLAFGRIHNPVINPATDNQNHKPLYFPPIEESEQDLPASCLDSDVSLRSVAEDEESFLSSSHNIKKIPKNNNAAIIFSNLNSQNRTNHNIEILEEYFPDILSHMQSLEIKYKPKSNYLSKQVEVTPLMRMKLVDWLIEVQDEYKLQNETLYLAVAFVDRFLSTMSVSRAKLQLLGTASMFLAAKYEEIYPPDATEFAYVTADTYTLAEVLLMERMILKVFNCTLSIPTTFQYLTIFNEKSNMGETVRYLSYYLSEMTLLNEKYLEFLPSVKAAAALTLALCTIRHSHFCDIANGNSESQEISTDIMNVELASEDFSETIFCKTIRDAMFPSINEIYDCVLEMAQSHLREVDSKHFLRDKYLSSTQKCSASITPLLADTSSNGAACLLSRSNVSGIWHS